MRGPEFSGMPNQAEPKTAGWESDLIAWEGSVTTHTKS